MVLACLSLPQKHFSDSTVFPCLQDLSEAAWPMTTDDTSNLRGQRFEQIGMNASQKLLESLLDGDLPPGLSGVVVVVVVDTCLNVGDMFFAWLERPKTLCFPIYFAGAPVGLEWFQHHVQEEMVEKISAGSLELCWQGQRSSVRCDYGSPTQATTQHVYHQAWPYHCHSRKGHY